MDFGTLIPIFGILLVMIPVAGLTFGLTLRLAVRPFVETIATALQASRQSPDPVELSLLRDELEALAYEVRQLRSAHEFDRQLIVGASEPPFTQSPTAGSPPAPRASP